MYSPTITNDFHALDDGEWYSAVYFFTGTAFLPTFGKIFQNYNAKKTYIAVVVIFMFGSFVSASASNSTAFILGRAIAGIGSAGSMPGGITMIAYTVPLHKRAAYMGILGSVYGVQFPIIMM